MHVGHVARRDRPLAPVEPPQLLEDLPGLLDPVGVALEADLAPAGEDLHPEAVAHLAEELVAAAEDGQFLVVVVQIDGHFRHRMPFADPSRPVAVPATNGPALPRGGGRRTYYGRLSRKNATSSREPRLPDAYTGVHSTTEAPGSVRYDVGPGSVHWRDIVRAARLQGTANPDQNDTEPFGIL